MDIVLIRQKKSNGAYGVLYKPDSTVICQTVEREWKDNKPCLSCIPDGDYTVEPYESNKFGKCYILSGGTVSKFKDDSFKRYGILIHPANFPRQLQGCIAPVTRIGLFAKDNGSSELGGFESRSAMERLSEVLKDDKHKLSIYWD